jgi:hypothetical protein
VPQPAIAPAGHQALARPEAQADPEAQDDQQAPAAGNDRTDALPAPSSPIWLFLGIAVSRSPAMPRIVAAGTDRTGSRAGYHQFSYRFRVAEGSSPQSRAISRTCRLLREINRDQQG